MKHYQLLIQGKVQKVGYRYYAQKKALSLGLTGFVQNLPGGEVYIEVEGPELELALFMDWCQEGPNLARVERVKKKEAPVKAFMTFEIK